MAAQAIECDDYVMDPEYGSECSGLHDYDGCFVAATLAVIMTSIQGVWQDVAPTFSKAALRCLPHAQSLK